ncbi:MAG TPA: hypothetical protein VFN03_09105 [Trueperaceae bacterium]|nr:hypothetical protein [Trueperaceae bacterium]
MKWKIVVLATALALAVPALAQETESSTATLAELRVEAQRLTALAQVPEAGRAEAEELLARVAALQESGRAQEIARLQAYIAALRSGDSPSVAEEVATSAVSEAAVELARESEALRADVGTFLETYPDAAVVFHRAFFTGRGEVFGIGTLGGVIEATGAPGRMIQVRPGGGRAGGFSMALPYGFEMPRIFSPRPDGRTAP